MKQKLILFGALIIISLLAGAASANEVANNTSESLLTDNGTLPDGGNLPDGGTLSDGSLDTVAPASVCRPECCGCSGGDQVVLCE